MITTPSLIFFYRWVNKYKFFVLYTVDVNYHMLSYLFVHTQRNLIREATAFLLDVLKPNLPEHAFLQTKVDNNYHLESLCAFFSTSFLRTYKSTVNTGSGDQFGNLS